MFVAWPETYFVMTANHNTDYIVYDVWLFIELIVVYFLFIETRGSSLEEISLMIDGPEMKTKMLENVELATVATFQEKKEANDGAATNIERA
jgi:hypothetical protein